MIASPKFATCATTRLSGSPTITFVASTNAPNGYVLTTTGSITLSCMKWQRRRLLRRASLGRYYRLLRQLKRREVTDRTQKSLQRRRKPLRQHRLLRHHHLLRHHRRRRDDVASRQPKCRRDEVAVYASNASCQMLATCTRSRTMATFK